MTDKETVNEELDTATPFEFAFVVMKGHDGNISIRPFKEDSKVSSEQIHSTCGAICRDIEAQGIAGAVAQTLMAAAAQYGRSDAGLVLPNDLKGSNNGK